MATEKAQPTPQELVLYTNDAPVQLPPERTQTWFLIARGKLKMDTLLQGHALKISALLTGFDLLTADQTTAKLKEYRDTHKQMVEDRQQFTRYLDMATGMCMATEKQYDPKTNAEYLRCVTVDISKREEASNKAKEASAKASEQANYRSHIENEYDRILTAYKLELFNYAHQTYAACLAAKTPPMQAQAAINTCITAFQSVQPGQMNPFSSVLVTQEERAAIFAGIRPPDWQAAYNEAIAELNNKFSTYVNDVQAAEAILSQVVNQHAIHTNALVTESANRQTATTLTNQAVAGGGLFVAPAGVKPVDEISRIKILDDNPNWVMWIISAFQCNFALCMPLVSVKKFSNLSVAQMAAALDKASVKVENVEYETIKK